MDEIVARIVSNLVNHLPISGSFLRDLETLLEYTVNSDDPIDLENLYNELSSKNLSLTSLTNAVSSAIDAGSSPSISILASKVYLLLLLSPKSSVFTMFTPIAFLNLLRAVRLAIKKPRSHSMEGSASRSPEPKKKKRRNLAGNKSRVEDRDSIEVDRGEVGHEIKDLFFVLEKLEMVLVLVHLDRFPDCLKALVQTVCDIPKTAFEFCGDIGKFERLCTLCSRILGVALKSEHGKLEDTAAEVLKALSPLILLSGSQTRRFGLGFVANKMVELGRNLNDIKKAVTNLPKYLVHKAPEKAEPRALAVESIMEIVKALDFEDQIEFASYVEKMSHGKGQLRILSVDFIPSLMELLGGHPEIDMVSGTEDSWSMRLLEVLILRCSDSAAGIRAKALTNLAQIVVNSSGNDSHKRMLKEGISRMNVILKIRCMDEKAAVRRAALLLISKVIAVLGGELDEELIKTAGMSCSDPLVSIRKVAISALSEALRTYSNCFVTREWLHSIPRLITDNETSIQEECENLFLELVIDQVSKAGSTSNNSVSRDSIGKINILEKGTELLLREITDGEVSPWVKKICCSLGKKKKLKPKIAIALQDIIRSSECQWLSDSASIEKWTAPTGAWFLLSEVSAFLPKAVNWEFLLHHWHLLDKHESVGLKEPLEQGDAEGTSLDVESNSFAWVGDRISLLQTITHVSLELPPEPAADLAHDFLKRLEGFNMHTGEVNAHVKALRTLCKQKSINPEEADSLVMRCVNQLLSKASQILDSYLSKITDANEENTFLTPLTSANHKGLRPPDSVSKLLRETIIAVYTIGSLIVVCPSANFKSIIPAIYTIITSRTSAPKSSKLPKPAVSVKQVAQPLYIQAWLTMGKICLADGKLAKLYLPLFMQELEKSDCAALRNNIVVMMADFCVRYTALVDCYMPKITKCLRDPCELIRRQTFILLSRLLQRDYVKWRGVLFLRFLLCLVDESEKIRQLADFLFGKILKAKAPLLAYNSFVEAVFVLNDCNAHTGRSNSNGSRAANNLFSIRGNDEKSRSQRMRIYATLLNQMAPEHLLATFAKVCAEILAAASDGMLSLDDVTSRSVLQDAFFILSSKEIRIQPNRGSSEAADTDDGGEAAVTGVGGSSAAKGKAITQAIRKGLIQNTIPIFIELKRLLENSNSPLIGSLMDCLRVLLKDYKNEIDDILVADRQLQKELIYDIQKYESLKAKSKAAEAVATMQQRSEAYRSPPPPSAAKGQNPKSVGSKLPECVRSNSKVVSAVADAAAEATVRSVLREVNRGAATPLSTMGVPKLKSRTGEAAASGGGGGGERPPEVIESLRRRQSFDSDDEN